jgi:hypothetical protein
MARRFDLARRLEAVHVPGDPTVARKALRAEVHDPAWFLARQWQLGEHRGEDAASPVQVEVSVTETPITHATPGPDHDPGIAPPETVIESEPEQWWTHGRRVRVGLALAGAVPADRRSDPALLLSGLAAPYDRLNGRGLDGLALFRARSDLGLPTGLFTAEGVPVLEPDDDWQPAALHYHAEFAAGPVSLSIPRHDGGDVDWYSVTATGTLPPPADPPAVRTSHPIRVSYPGAPAPRWWQISDHRNDPGALAPHRTQLASLLMIHATATHHDDWFTAPLVTPVGALVTVEQLQVRDSMDLTAAADPLTDWSLFQVSGLGTRSMLVWPTVLGPITAPASLDDVLLGVDEDANVLWAVEQRVDGADVAVADVAAPAGGEPPPTGQVVVTGRPGYRYLPSSTVPRFWYPYVLSDNSGARRFLQGRLADLTSRPVRPLPGPTSRLLRTPGAGTTDPDHIIEPSAIPRRGLRIQRRHVLGRRTDGLPVLWVQRQTTPLQAPPVSGLLFDVLEQIPQVVGEQT